METKSSFESIQSIISAHARPKSQIVHSQLASEANYVHLLTSLQPPAKYPPDDELERSEGLRRAAGTVLLFSLLTDFSKSVRRSSFNHLKRTAFFQGDNFAEYFSSVGSVSKLKEIEVLQNCERALLRFASRRVAGMFARWREWARWLRRELMGALICLVGKLRREKLANAFNRIRTKAVAQKYTREKRLQQVSLLWLSAANHGFGGVQSSFSTWKLSLTAHKVVSQTSLQTRILKFKVKSPVELRGQSHLRGTNSHVDTQDQSGVTVF